MRDLFERWHGPRHETYIKRFFFLGFLLPIVFAYAFAFASGVKGTNGRFNIFFRVPNENPTLYFIANALMIFACLMGVLFLVDAAIHARR